MHYGRSDGTRYGAVRIFCLTFEIIAVLAIILGIATAIGGLGSDGPEGQIDFVIGMSSSFGAFVGLVMTQLIRATIDTAEATREMLTLMRSWPPSGSGYSGGHSDDSQQTRRSVQTPSPARRPTGGLGIALDPELKRLGVSVEETTSHGQEGPTTRWTITAPSAATSYAYSLEQLEAHLDWLRKSKSEPPPTN
jgi:hypothetical protein